MAGRNQKGWLDRLVAVCLSLMAAVIALSVAATIIQPYLPALSVAALIVILLALWRAWHRSRW